MVTLNKPTPGVTPGPEWATKLNAALDALNAAKLEADALGRYVDINAQTGTTYTLVLSDQGKFITLTNASPITLTVPPNSSVAFPVGAQVDLAAMGDGMVTVTPGSGVTVNGTPSLVTRAQYSAVTLIKLATNTWLAVGDLADA
ncbi:hypothetical protein [Microbacterium sp.]|uniref:hypothetical protein n=1 Tax=Actinomycetes TaxID=1760 RepID=UPI0037C818E9